MLEQRRLGTTDLRVSEIAYGYWRFAGTDVLTARAKVETALGCGMTLMDHADIYGAGPDGQFGDAESLFGKVLAEDPGLREQMVLATKAGIVLGVPYDSSCDYIRLAVENSLRRLGVDTIDLYQLHRPDYLAHPAELARTLTELRNAGKIREVGVSNYSVSQTRALQAHLEFDLATHQPEFSALSPHILRDGIADYCLETGMTPLAWSPLGGGRLFSTDADETTTAVQRELDRIGADFGVSRSATALAWILRHPSRPIPILGTQSLHRIEDALEAKKVVFTRRDWNAVLVASDGKRLP